MSGYQLDHQWHGERKRLASVEALFDPLTIECMEAVGIRPGWACLEVGAGGGSMAVWLAKRVGTHGRVVAIDLETTFLDTLQEPNLEIRRQDIVKDALEANAFDLIHARGVLEHLAARDTVLDKLIRALKPNGLLLIGSGDYGSFASADSQTASFFDRGQRAHFRVLETEGFDAYYGRKVAPALRARQLADVHMRGVVTEWGGDRPGTLAWTYLFERLREKVLAAKLLTTDEMNEFRDLVNAPKFTGITPMACYAWGRKSGHTGK